MKNLTFARIGTVGMDGVFSVTGLKGSPVITADISALKRSWQKTLEWM